MGSTVLPTRHRRNGNQRRIAATATIAKTATNAASPQRRSTFPAVG